MSEAAHEAVTVAPILPIVVLATLMLVAAALIFRLVGWLTEGFEDNVVRRRLDVLYDRLDAVPLRDLTQAFLRRFAVRWEATFGSGPGGLSRFVFVSTIINIIASAVSYILLFDLWTQATASALGWGILYVAGCSLFGLVPDLAVRAATRRLLRPLVDGNHRHLLLRFFLKDAGLLFAAVTLNVYGGVLLMTFIAPPLRFIQYGAVDAPALSWTDFGDAGFLTAAFLWGSIRKA